MTLSRRMVLRGLGGVALGLPALEGFASRSRAHAQAAATPPYAFFLRQANGVACEQQTGEIGNEPERFWPRTLGALTPENVQDRAVGELADYCNKLLIVRGVNMFDFNYGDGHARGALQGLTARGPVVEAQAGSSEAAGESLDHRIGRELNPNGRDSLFMYAGVNEGWLGGACISYRGAAQRRAPLHNPKTAYDTVAGVASSTPEAAQMLSRRQASINDLVREQMQKLLGMSRLSQSDRERLDLHFQSVRDLEVALSCRAAADQEAALDGIGNFYASSNGDEVMAAARLHIDVAVLAIACGYTRSVALQIGNGNDGTTTYRNPETGALMENYHYISHRRLSHDSSGAIVPGSDLLHHYIDAQFAQLFKYLLDKLSAYGTPEGTLLDAGISVWYNDEGNGPAHSPRDIPYVVAGSASGFLKQGQYLEIAGQSGDASTHNEMLNTLGSAVGLRNASGGYLDDFGDPSLGTGVCNELLA